jgi:hypothetical protein
VGPDHLLGHVVNCCHSWCPPDQRVSCCQVYTLERLIIDSNLRDTLRHELFTMFKRSNSTFIMIYLVHDMDINYLVVDEMINIKIV